MSRRYYPPQDPQQAPQSGTLDGVITTLNNISTQVAHISEQQANLEKSFQTYRENLPEKFMPRMELNERLSALERADNALNTRVVAVEEWRLAQTQREADRLTQIQQQNFQQQSNTQQQLAAVQKTAAEDVTSQRMQIDSRLINFLWGALTIAAGVLMAKFLR